MKIDYEFKSEVLKTDIPKLANQISKALYADFALREYGQIVKSNMDIGTALEKRCFLLQNFPREYKEAERINFARYKRVIRLSGRIKKILSQSDCAVFLTLTFNDDCLQSTSDKTRRQYVSRYLKASGHDFVANVDFGAKNGREHYHAVVGGTVDLKEWNDKHGFALAEYIQLDNHLLRPIPKKYKDLPPQEQKERLLKDNEKALAKYVAKLTNHAIKETTRRSVAIYSAPRKGEHNKKPLVYEVGSKYESPFTDYQIDMGDGVSTP